MNSIGPLQGLTPCLKVFISALYWIAKPAINSIGPLQGPPQNLKFLFWLFIGRFLSYSKKKKGKFVEMITHCHSLSLVFIFCTTPCHMLSLVVTRHTTCCNSLSLVVNRWITRLFFFYKQSRTVVNYKTFTLLVRSIVCITV